MKTTLAKVRAAEITDHLLDCPGELSGLADADLQIETQGAGYKLAMSNLSGTGSVTVHSGKVTRFGQLQTRLTQANLVHQGLFGFNLNNLIQSFYPVRTGQFKELSGEFQITRGVLSIHDLRFDGDDMRLWGAGRANLPSSTLEVEVAGKIPRVTSSALTGTLGEMSRAFTLQKIVSFATMHQFDELPAVPVLGELAADRPRTFSFKVLAPIDEPKMVAQSIEKSFHWLDPKPYASAHPVPGI